MPHQTSATHESLPQQPGHPGTARLVPDDVVAHTLLNCLVREVSAPERQTVVDGDHLLVRLPRSGVLLRVAVRRLSQAGGHRLRGPAARWSGGHWEPLGAEPLAELIGDELALRTGAGNPEFVEQVRSSREALARAHAVAPPAPPTSWRERYLDSEQSLVVGHRYHPAPKARSDDPATWAAYAPEARATFPLRVLAVREDLVAQDVAPGWDARLLDGVAAVPPGYAALPAHPWQWQLVGGHRAVREALTRADLVDLGPCGPVVAPTASVRTVAAPGGFLKFSLNVRITNCVRKNAAYELTGAVALTSVLGPVARELETRHPGVRLLPEPAYRSVRLGTGDEAADRAVLEGLGVIVREDLGPHLREGVTPLLAAAVADEYPNSHGHVSRLTDGRGAAQWWRCYVRLLAPVVLEAFFRHGVVLEPHLQNVVVGVTPDGLPEQLFLRDLEGTKLVASRHAGTLADLASTLGQEAADRIAYDEDRGWKRVAYCLLVNNLTEVLGALADLPGCVEEELWAVLRTELAAWAGERGDPLQLRAVLSGVPVPAKANLFTRWDRRPDRDAGYVPLALPLDADPLGFAGERGRA
jgi:siderophore synthetase component